MTVNRSVWVVGWDMYLNMHCCCKCKATSYGTCTYRIYMPTLFKCHYMSMEVHNSDYMLTALFTLTHL